MPSPEMQISPDAQAARAKEIDMRIAFIAPLIRDVIEDDFIMPGPHCHLFASDKSLHMLTLTLISRSGITLSSGELPMINVLIAFE